MSLTGDLQSGPLSIVERPSLIPKIQPTFPELQSVSQPAVLTIINVF